MRIPDRKGVTASPFRIACSEIGASHRIAEHIRCVLEHLGYHPHRRVVILCIGTDRSTGDALGPLTGSLLSSCPGMDAEVRGTLEEPVHASNLTEEIERISTGSNPIIIAVDACLGQTSQVGTVSVGVGPLRPGAGVNKSLPAVGDLYLTGTVNVGGFMEYLVLQNTRLNLVVKMARVLSGSLAQVFGGVWEGQPRFVV